MAENQNSSLPPAAITDTLTLILRQLQELKEENQVIKAQLSEKLGPSLSKDKGSMHHTVTSAAPAQPVFIPIPDKTEEVFEKEQYSEDRSRPSQSMVDKVVMEKLESLTRKVQDIQFQDQGGFNPSDLTLFPEIRLPANFQMPDFDKYDGVGCPITHLQMFTIMCQPQGLSSEQMAQLFPVSLTKVARRWFMVLDKTRYRTWKDIGEQFIRQFKYDDGTEITRKDLERTKQDLRESFLTFVKRWRRIAAQMMERPSEEEQVQIIMKNISPQLQYHMSLQYYPDFKHFIVAGTQIEEAMAQDYHLKEDGRILDGLMLEGDEIVDELPTFRDTNPVQAAITECRCLPISFAEIFKQKLVLATSNTGCMLHEFGAAMAVIDGPTMEVRPELGRLQRRRRWQWLAGVGEMDGVVVVCRIPASLPESMEMLVMGVEDGFAKKTGFRLRKIREMGSVAGFWGFFFRSGVFAQKWVLGRDGDGEGFGGKNKGHRMGEVAARIPVGCWPEMGSEV
ncbi:uncharacterized protein LOC143891087 [Tasmannia lanceolata]|uniref:uncharacterized protein LOC143891087 n=1 Tax=Tasmannia lanceolata TaxID=3420 RepID=UPI00406427B3